MADSFDHKGMTIQCIDNRNTPDAETDRLWHLNREGEQHKYTCVWWPANLNYMRPLVTYFPNRAGGSYWIVDSNNYEDDAPDENFFDDEGPYPTLEAALDALLPYAAAARLGEKSLLRA